MSVTRVSLGQILLIIGTASGALTAAAAAVGVLRQTRKLDEIHVLVNSNLTVMQTRNEQLAQLLIENGVTLPPLPPQPPGAAPFPKKVT